MCFVVEKQNSILPYIILRTLVSPHSLTSVLTWKEDITITVSL